MRFAICNEIFQDWKIEDAIRYAAQTGYDAIEVAPFTLADRVTDIPAPERARIRDAAGRAGIRVSGIHWVLMKTEGLHLTHPEAGVRARTARYFVDLVDFCADLGGQFMVIGSPKQRSLMPGVSREAAADHARGVLRDAVKRGEDRDVTLCLEPLSTVETDFLNTAAEAIALVAPVDSPRLRMMLDVKAMCSESRAIPEIIRQSWPWFAYVHANDRNLKGPGFGDVDFTPIARALGEVGYDGFVSVEVFNFEDGPETIAGRSLRYLREVFDRRPRP